MNRCLAFATALALTLVVLPTSGTAHEAHHHNEKALHFSHPLISESPSPDTKIRLDYKFESKPGKEEEQAGARVSTINLEGEYAFNKSFSVEVNIPYSFRDSEEDSITDNTGNVEIAFKYANYTFEEKGLLLGGGLEFGLPTGNTGKEIGSSHVLEIAPFLNFGYRHDPFELVGFVKFGFPINENTDDETDLELGWNLSLLYQANEDIQLLLELDGEHVYNGEEDGHEVVNITPGVKYQPFAQGRFQVGAGVSFPLTEDKEFYVMPVISAFYHF